MWNSRIEVSNVDLGEVLGSPLVRCPQARGLGSIPGRGTEILQARQCGQKKKKKKPHTHKKDVGPGVGIQLCHFLVKRPCTVQLFLLQFSSL